MNKRILGVKTKDGWIVTIPLISGGYKIGRGATIYEAMEDAGTEVE
jgi:hypothetical protein